MVQVYPLRVRKDSFINYTYVVVNKSSQEALLIDPGWEPDTIMHCLLKTECTLRGILLTHHHPDHTQLAAYFASTFKVPVYMSQA